MTTPFKTLVQAELSRIQALVEAPQSLYNTPSGWYPKEHVRATLLLSQRKPSMGFLSAVRVLRFFLF